MPKVSARRDANAVGEADNWDNRDFDDRLVAMGSSGEVRPEKSCPTPDGGSQRRMARDILLPIPPHEWEADGVEPGGGTVTHLSSWAGKYGKGWIT